jgi:radical SAM superfamily enzyme YgiQ (UPF0313 family)
MKVLLINPPYRAEQRYGKDMAKFGPTNEPLGLAYLAGMLEDHGHHVQIWDGMVQEFKEIRPADVVGITMLTPMYEQSKAMIKLIRGMYPNVRIVVGGAHPTALPTETLKDIPEIDYVIRGDGEYHLLDYVDGTETEHSNDLDDLPLPARHLLPMSKYQMTASRSRSGHAFTIIVARGCPFKCGFCSRIHGRKVRFHSIDRVMNEILTLRLYGAKEINFEADTITVNKKFINDLCGALIISGVSKKIRWTCESRVDTVDEDMLRRMKEAGCWQISYGVETGTQRLLDLIQKGTNIEQIERTFRITKKAGISIRAFYMLGLPTESKAETQATIDFACKLNAKWSQFTLYTPFPGTALWDIAAKEAPISKDWADFRTHAGWTTHQPAWVPHGRTAEEMKEAQKRAYRSVYLRPGAMLRHLADVRTVGQASTLWQGFMTVAKTAWGKA